QADTGRGTHLREVELLLLAENVADVHKAEPAQRPVVAGTGEWCDELGIEHETLGTAHTHGFTRRRADDRRLRPQRALLEAAHRPQAAAIEVAHDGEALAAQALAPSQLGVQREGVLLR